MRTCSRCAIPLSSYNEGTLCGPCEVAARHRGETDAGAETLPLTFWFRPDIRTALARWDWGAVLTGVSKEAHLSQADLGTRVGLSQAQVSRLMGGRSKEPGRRTVLGIVDALGIPRLLAGLAPGGLDHLTRESDEQAATVDRVERRTFGKTVVAITLAIPLADTQPGQPVDVTRLTPDDVVADLYQLDDRYGGAAIGDVARRRLARLTRQMDRASLSPAVETRVQSMIGTLSTCCAWLAFDSGDHRRARAFDSDALCAAHLANDKALQVEVLASMSMQARRNDKPGEAINLAQSALGIGGSDPRVEALLSMRVASASARRKDIGGFKEARRGAWKYMERARKLDRPAWYRFVDERELSGLEALALMELGRNTEAADLLRDATSNRALLRNGAYYSAVRARALVAAGAPDEAAGVVNDTLPAFTEVTSARVFDELAKVRRGLEPYLGDADIAECANVIEGLVYS
jgi:transcriptional regulator with XRE-family HTH domain